MKIRRLHSPKRVFIGITLAEELATNFARLQAAIGDVPGRFIPLRDIHLTLVPPFQTRDLPFVESELHRALGETHRFRLRFLRLELGPEKGRPRLAWVLCTATADLVALKKRLLRTFKQKEKVPFVPHMTIARFKPADAAQLARHPIKRPVRLSMEAASVDLFESPHKGGSGYNVLARVTLQPKDGAPL